MSISRNLIAGLSSSTWSAIIGFAAVPFYIKYLGIEAYGLIGFFVTMQAVLFLLDMGIAPTISREVARHSATGNITEAGKLLSSLAVIYWAIAVVIALSIWALSPLIADYWLQAKDIPKQSVSNAVMLIGLVIACRWPIGLYQGAIVGAQKIVVSSIINIGTVTVSTCGAIIILSYISPTIHVFFIWQAFIGLISSWLMGNTAWRIIGKRPNKRIDITRLKTVWRFTAGMSGIALSATLLSQIDKVILSKTLALEEYGHYMLANTVVGVLYLLIMPMFNVIYPRLSALVAINDVKNVTELYRLGTRVFATIIFPIAMLLAVFSEELVYRWTGNASVASNIFPIIALMSIGSALHGVMYFQFALQLAHGATRLPLMINLLLMAFIVPVTIYLAISYGLLGGAMAWLLFQVFYVLLGTWLTHQQLLKGIGFSWLYKDVGIPFAINSIAGVILYNLVQQSHHSFIYNIFEGIGLACVSLLLSFLILPKPSKLALYRKSYH